MVVYAVVNPNSVQIWLGIIKYCFSSICKFDARWPCVSHMLNYEIAFFWPANKDGVVCDSNKCMIKLELIVLVKLRIIYEKVGIVTCCKPFSLAAQSADHCWRFSRYLFESDPFNNIGSPPLKWNRYFGKTVDFAEECAGKNDQQFSALPLGWIRKSRPTLSVWSSQYRIHAVG